MNRKKVPILIILIVISTLAFTNESVDTDQHSILEQAKSFYLKGGALGRKGVLDSALYYIDQAVKLYESIQPTDSILLANSYQSLGIIYKLLGKYDDAIYYYDMSEKIYRKLGNYFLLGYLHSNRASILKIQQNYTKSKDYLIESIIIFSKDSLKYKLQLATSYNNLGNVYLNLNDYLKAIECYKKSLKLKGEKGSSYITLGNLALCYNNLSNFKLSEHYHLKAIETAINHFNNDKNLNLAKRYLNYANFLVNQNNFGKSRRYFNQTYHIYTENFGEKHPDISLLFNDIGNFYLKISQSDSALLYFQKSLIAITPNFSEINFYSNPSINSVISKTHFLSSLKNKALVLSLLAEENNSSDYYLASLHTYDLAIKTINKIRSGYISEESKLFLAENEFETYSQALVVCNNLFKLTGNKKYINNAFFYSESGKSAILAEALKNTQALNIGGIPDTLLTKEKELEKGIWNYEELIYEENKKKNPDKRKLEYWNKYLFELKLKYDELIAFMENNFQKYHSLKHRNTILSIKEVQNKLHRKDIIIEYFYSDKSIYTILLSKNTTDLIEYKIDEHFDYHLDKLLASLSNNNFSNHGYDEFKQFQESSFYIYSKLILPIEKYIQDKNIVVIPDGKLAYLPFEILTTQNAKFNRINYKELPYFVYKKNINYSYSTSFLFENNSYNKTAVKNLGAFAPTYSNLNNIPTEFTSFRQEYREKLFPLKGIKTEVQEISNLLNGDKYLDYEANEGKFKEVAHLYDILHLAMHTIMDDKNPMYSKMAFTQKGDSIEDGFLNTYELYNMKLNSRMAVLSSCNSGTGKLQRGEGVMSLARGFIYSGCPSIIMTLWSVEDKSGVKLMTSFYKYLLQGKTKSEAIQQSKIDFIKGADQLRSHPYFWSGYVVIGNNQPLFKSFWNHYLLISGIVILIGAGFLIFYRKSKLFNRSQN